MRRLLELTIKIGVFLLLCWSMRGHAQAPTTIPITGNVTSITGGQTPYAGVYLTLQNCPSPITVPGSSVIAPAEYQIQADGAGAINSNVWPVDKIDCNGTTGQAMYGLQYVVNGTPQADPVCYQPVSTMGTWNLNAALTPVSCAATPPNPQDATYNNLTINDLLNAANLVVNGDFNDNQKINQSYTSTTGNPIEYTSPVWNNSIADHATVQQTSTAQGDQYVTPVHRIVSSDFGINDTAPLYTYHNCDFTGSNSPAPCVGAFFVAQNNTADLHNGLWGINPLAIQYVPGSRSLTYGVETNVFNQTGVDPGSPSTPTGLTAPLFGVAATIGGTGNGTAAFLATDTNLGHYWYDGLWVERAVYAALEAGPVTGGSGLQYSVVSNPEGQAQTGTNYPAIPQVDLVNDWNGIGSYLETMTRQFVPNTGSNPVNCYNFTFSSNLRHQFCDDGTMVLFPASPFTGGIRITPDADGENNYAIAVTDHANTTTPFYVLKNGSLYATTAQINGPVYTGTTTFTVSGCLAGLGTGTGTAGIFVLGANSCSAVVTLNGATGMIAQHGWSCDAHDRNNTAVAIRGETSSTQTTATFSIPSTAAINDVVSFSCTAY